MGYGTRIFVAPLVFVGGRTDFGIRTGCIVMYFYYSFTLFYALLRSFY